MSLSYPLQWPSGQHRTPSYQRKDARFDTSQNIAQQALMEEIRKLGGKNPILSTMIRVRNDGLPYSSQNKNIEDPGAAVYFTYKGKQMCFACDKWNHIKDNIQAIRKTIEALRGIERWGSGDMMERAFTGFQALPNPERHWTDILGVDANATIVEIESAYRRKARDCHPDHGGTDELMSRLNAARDKAKKEKLND